MKNRIYLYPLVLLAILTLLSCKDGGTSDDTTLYDVTVSIIPSDTAGTIAPAADSSYEAGQTLELTARPTEGLRFNGWGKDTTSTGSVLSLTMDQSYNLTAAFVPAGSHELTILVEPEDAGTVREEIVQAKDYEWGTKVQLTAEPAENYEFKEWREGQLSTNTDNPWEITITEPRTLTAVFESPFYLAENGVTIRCPGAAVGARGTVGGTEYTKRTADQITLDNAATTCTSGITDMTKLFAEESTFNEDISHWDMSSVTDMNHLFFRASAFDQDIGSWDVSNVTDMSQMFFNATAFNQNLRSWDVSNVTNHADFAHGSDIEGNPAYIPIFGSFYMAKNGVTIKCTEAAVGDKGTVGDTEYTKRTADQISTANASTTCTSGITDMSSMFDGATDFNEDISHWDVSSVETMQNMFLHAESFNQDIGNWNVSNVTDMSGMLGTFTATHSFNQDIGSWDVSSVRTMEAMFNGAKKFNQDIADWNVSDVSNMEYMFNGAAAFDQNISEWCVSISEPTDFANNAGFEGKTTYMPNWGCSE